MEKNVERAGNLVRKKQWSILQVSVGQRFRRKRISPGSEIGRFFRKVFKNLHKKRAGVTPRLFLISKRFDSVKSQ